MLFPLTLAPTTPLWQVALGIAFGIVIGKEIFGGVGYNVLNPALTGRAFLFFAYPAQISGDQVWVGSASKAPLVNQIMGYTPTTMDGVTMATPLGVAASSEGVSAQTALADAGYSLKYDFWSHSRSIGSTSVIAILLGLGYLMITGVASSRIIFSGIAGAAAMGALFNLLPLNDSFAALPFTTTSLWEVSYLVSFLWQPIRFLPQPVIEVN